MTELEKQQQISSNEGAKVAIIGRNEKLNDEVNEIISITSGEVIGISADVSNENNVKGMVRCGE